MGRKQVADVDVEVLGVEHAQYFVGASCEEYDARFVGIGRSQREALADALEQAEGWEFGELEPDPAQYSDKDEVEEVEAESIRDACGPRPDPRYRVVLRPFNGCGPIVVAEGLSVVEAGQRLSRYVDKADARGMETADLVPETCETTGVALGQAEVQWEGQGVGDDEGLVSVELEPECARSMADWDKSLERMEEEPSELSFYVVVRVAAAEEVAL